MLTLLGYAWGGLVLLSSLLFVWIVLMCQRFVPDPGTGASVQEVIPTVPFLGAFAVIYLWWLLVSVIDGILWISTSATASGFRYFWVSLLVLAVVGLLLFISFGLVSFCVVDFGHADGSAATRQTMVNIIGMTYGAIVLLNLFWLWRFYAVPR